MPTIKNKTTQLLCLTSRDGDVASIPSEQSRSITDELWADNKDQPNVQAMLDNRQIFVIQGSEPGPVADVTPASVEPSSDGDDSGGWSTMHYRTAAKLIAAESSTSTLEKLLENETRPKFVEMLSARIEEIEAS